MGETNRSASDVLTENEAEIFDRVAAGAAITALAEEYGLSARTFYRWANATPEREEAWQEARRASADALLDQGLEILDDTPPESTAAVAHARNRADFRRHLASLRNPDYAGGGPEVNVNLDLGALHLEALKARGHMDQMMTPPVLEAEVYNDGDNAGALPAGGDDV